MKITLRYGRTGLEVEVPDENGVKLCCLNPVPKLDAPEQASEVALRSPLGSQPLLERAKGKGSACVVISDITRPVPNKLILPPLLKMLEEAGIPRQKITLLIATGTHRANTDAELREMVGDEIVESYRIVNHDCRDEAHHAYLGTTSLGVPALVDTRYLQADLKIVTGLIEPHLMAGYSGGRKLVCPGISKLEVVKVFHSPQLLEHPKATTGILDGNPVHRASCEVIEKTGCDFSVMVTMDEKRDVTGIFAGDVHESFLAGVQLVDKAAKVWLDEPVDIVITSSAGYPLDTTFYQAIKGLVGVMPIVKQGGTIILAASLSEGLGSPWFRQIYDEIESLDEFMTKILRGEYYRDDQWQVEEQAKVAKKAEIMVYSDGVSMEELAKAFVTPLNSVQEGIERALRKHGPKATIAVVPDGPYVMPMVRNST